MDASVSEHSVVNSAGGGGATGGVRVSPAKANADRETMRVEIATNRLSLDIVLFVLFIEGSLA